MEVKIDFLKRHPLLKDIMSLVFFVGCVVLGTLILNAFVFRSYNVMGSSMENTLHNNDRVIVNRLPVTWSHLFGNDYIPKRGDIVVIANGEKDGKTTCDPPAGIKDKYLIKRVIALPGEHIKLKDDVFAIHIDNGQTTIDPDEKTRKNGEGPKKNETGEGENHKKFAEDLNIVVPPGEIFVAGDNREDSRDSRNALGTIPLCRVVGPVQWRLFPFNKIRSF